MSKINEREERERRREAVRGMLAKGMKRFEMCAALEEQGFFPKGKAKWGVVLSDIKAIRREDAQGLPQEEIKAAKREYIRRLEEIYKMAMAGSANKKELSVMMDAARRIFEQTGGRPDDVKLTPELVAKMPRWEAVVRECGVFRRKDTGEIVNMRSKKREDE